MLIIRNLNDSSCNVDDGKQRSDFNTLLVWLDDIDEKYEYDLARYDHQYKHTCRSCTDTYQTTRSKHTSFTVTF